MNMYILTFVVAAVPFILSICSCRQLCNICKKNKNDSNVRADSAILLFPPLCACPLECLKNNRKYVKI